MDNAHGMLLAAAIQPLVGLPVFIIYPSWEMKTILPYVPGHPEDSAVTYRCRVCEHDRYIPFVPFGYHSLHIFIL